MDEFYHRIQNDGADCDEAQYAKQHLNEGLLLEIQNAERSHNHRKDEKAELVGVATWNKVRYDDMLKALLRAHIQHAGVEWDVSSPGRPRHSCIAPSGQETVDCHNHQVEILDPPVKEDLTKLGDFELSMNGDVVARVVPDQRRGIVFG